MKLTRLLLDPHHGSQLSSVSLRQNVTFINPNALTLLCPTSFHIAFRPSKCPASLSKLKILQLLPFFLSLAVLLHSTVAPLFRIPACTHLLFSSAVEDSRVHIPVMTRWAEFVPIGAPCAPLLFHTVRSFFCTLCWDQACVFRPSKNE